jgi:hypothetical protein
MVRRRIFFGAAIVLLIVIVLVINGCVKSQKQQSLKDYNHHVGEIAQEFDSVVATPLFTALAGASGKSALDLQVTVNQLRGEAQKLTDRAKELSVPGEMAAAQRDLLLALDLRVEGLTKIDALLPSALGGQAKQVSPKIAGAMETFLASDVIYSQRVAPLIQQTLADNDITASTAATRFLPNLGWLESSTVQARLTGQGSGSSSSSVSSGTHGDALISVAVGTNTLEPEPALNHVAGGGNPTFTVTAEDTGTNTETNVGVNVTLTEAGKAIKESRTISSISPGQKINVEIPFTGVTVGVGYRVEVMVVGVPGETNLENNKNSYLAIFGE